MKEFEKWLNSKSLSERSGFGQNGATEGWRAALEMVLSLSTLCDGSLDKEVIYEELGVESPEKKYGRELRELGIREEKYATT